VTGLGRYLGYSTHGGGSTGPEGEYR